MVQDFITTMWNKKILPLQKWVFFAREFWWDKVLTMNNLKRMVFPLASRCPFCGEAEEDLHHLVIHYPKICGEGRELLSCSGAV